MSKNEEILDLVKRYEQLTKEQKSIYFDADQFGDIATYYDSIEDIDTAKDVIEMALKIHPESESLLIKKAKILAFEDSYDEALYLLESISGYDLDASLVKLDCFLQLENLDDAKDIVKTILNKEGKQDLHFALAEIGFLYVEADYFAEAINFFEKSLSLSPENPEVLSDLTYSYEMLGDFNKAIETCNKLLDINSYNYDAWINLGKLHSLNENYASAVEAFDFALTIHDGDLNILKLRAHCLSLSGRILDAIAAFKELLIITPEDTSLYLLLAECYASLELFVEALEMLERYKEEEGETKDYFIKKASLFSQMGKFDQAIALTNEAIDRFGKKVDLLLVSGDIKFNSNDADAAKRDYEIAYMLESDDFEILDKLALVNIRLENYQDAIRYTIDQLALEPQNLELKQRLALLYFETNGIILFNETMESFSNEELMSFLKLFYTPNHPEYFDRESLLAALNSAREYRTLFKNLRH